MSGGGKYTWEARDKKKGMTGSELEEALLGAKAMFGSTTPLKVRIKIGWSHQLEEITFEQEGIPEHTKASPVRTPPQVRPA